MLYIKINIVISILICFYFQNNQRNEIKLDTRTYGQGYLATNLVQIVRDIQIYKTSNYSVYDNRDLQILKGRNLRLTIKLHQLMGSNLEH